MTIEKLTRELGKAIQQDERYLAMRKAVAVSYTHLTLPTKA